MTTEKYDYRVVTEINEISRILSTKKSEFTEKAKIRCHNIIDKF